ncbi:MAG: penicillin acylase family protein [Actinomycetia bacterium]|nr:penicillin acylase family protein [Actinomycetes bacterium]
MTRRSKIRGAVLVVAIGVVIALVAGVVLAVTGVRRPFPTASGEITIPGLSGPVEVLRDERGVPHIYADTADDLAMAQGFVHAQDRFFQMDLRRHITAGRLAELVGEAGVASDTVVRTLGWRRVAEQELPLLEPRTRRLLQAYSDGVNAYLDRRTSPSSMGLEYVILGQQFGGYSAEEWTPVDSLAWLKAMAWDLKGNYEGELTRARLAGRMTRAQIQELYPAYDFVSHPPILTAADWDPSDSDPTDSRIALEGLGVSIADADQVEAAFGTVHEAMESMPELVGRGPGTGSNSWVVTGERSSTGQPLLANDPHLAVDIPSTFYQVGLHCRATTPSCPLNVSGFSFAGFPGVIIGHNDQIAWGLTNLGADVTDFYLHRLNDNGEYFRDGEYIPLPTRTETITVAGGEDEQIEIRETAQGPLLSDVLASVSDAGSNAPVQGREVRERYAVALAWTGLTPTRVADAVVGINTATNFSEFRSAAEKFAVPAQNLIYADVEGNIGYQTPGMIPVRTAAVQGAAPGYWPAPGWDSSFDWRGYVPFEDLPFAYNPDDEIIVAANQAVSESAVPFLTTEWDHGYRATQVRALLDEVGTVSPDDMREIQMDSHHSFAPTLVNALLQIDTNDDPFTAQAQRLLLDWDFTTPADASTEGAAAAYYNAVWRNLLTLLFDDELPRDLWVSGGAQHQAAVTQLLRRPDSPWWDNKQTPGITEERDEILRQALQAARLELTRQLGKDPTSWDWGRLHTLTFEHPVIGGSSVPFPIRWLANRGPYRMPGGPAIVNANAWSANEGYEVDRGPAMRMVIDLADLDASTWVNQTGQSGHVHHVHYDDQIEPWIAGTQFPWLHTEDAVREATQDRLTLIPGE